mgnify:FL=1
MKRNTHKAKDSPQATVQVCGLPFLFGLENFAFLFGRGTLDYNRMGWG